VDFQVISEANNHFHKKIKLQKQAHYPRRLPRNLYFRYGRDREKN
jgi:hypothetical protein